MIFVPPFGGYNKKIFRLASLAVICTPTSVNVAPPLNCGTRNIVLGENRSKIVIEGLDYITVIFQRNAISGKQGSDLHFCFRFTSSVRVKRLLVLFYTVCKFFFFKYMFSLPECFSCFFICFLNSRMVFILVFF